METKNLTEKPQAGAPPDRSGLLGVRPTMKLLPNPEPGDIFMHGDHHSKYLIYAGASGEYRVPNGPHNMPGNMAAHARKKIICWSRSTYVRKSVFKFDMAHFQQCLLTPDEQPERPA